MGGSLEGSHEVASGRCLKGRLSFCSEPEPGEPARRWAARAWCGKLRGRLPARAAQEELWPPGREQLLASLSARPWSASFSQSFQSCSPSSGSLRGSRSAAASSGVSPGLLFSPPVPVAFSSLASPWVRRPALLSGFGRDVCYRFDRILSEPRLGPYHLSKTVSSTKT